MPAVVIFKERCVVKNCQSDGSSLTLSRQLLPPSLPPSADKKEELGEEKLLELIKFGTDNERKYAIGIIFDRHHKYVANMIARNRIYGQDAEDVFGSIWIIIVEKIADFQYQGTPLLHWLSRITRIQIDAFFRKKGEENGRFINGEDEWLETLAIIEDALRSEPTPELSKKMKHLITITLPHLLDQLSEKDREVIMLSFIEGLDSTQIAEALRTKPGTVRQRKRRALNKLKVFGEKEISNDNSKY